jgi:NADPH:quinone reductase-like Zn-dependent oxidoreductase
VATSTESYVNFHSCLQHVEVPVPIPKKDEVLLKLEAASLNPFDWKVQKGMLRPFLPRKFPHIPGNQFCLGGVFYFLNLLACQNLI